MSRLVVEGVSVTYGAGRSTLTAVDRVSLAIAPGRTHGLVGESGSGKSSIARGIVGLARCSGGQVRLDGVDVANAKGEAAAPLRRGVQMVFQNPYASLNPRMTVAAIVGEAIEVHRPGTPTAERRCEVLQLLDLVGLGGDAGTRFPHQFSGGQRQRIAVARALATGAGTLLLDEVTSALDVSVQANILNLLRRLQRERGLSYLFISHDLAVVRYMSDEVSVMYLGRLVESGPVEALFAAPRHPYTRALIEAVPGPRGLAKPGRRPLAGEIPDPHDPPSGCRFRTRCPVAAADAALARRCASVEPVGLEIAPGHAVYCHAATAG